VRIGIETIWDAKESVVPRVRGVEFAAITALLLISVVMTTSGAAVLQYTDATVAWLHRPQDYVEAVLGAPPDIAAPGETVP
jgi:multicomponent K+:H+ antiporter subunit D